MEFLENKKEILYRMKIYDFAKNGLYCKNSEWG